MALGETGVGGRGGGLIVILPGPFFDRICPVGGCFFNFIHGSARDVFVHAVMIDTVTTFCADL